MLKEYLIPRQLSENGLLPDEVNFSEEAINTVIRSYTREAGVRSLERRLGSVLRKIVTLVAEDKQEKYEVTPELVKNIWANRSSWKMTRLLSGPLCQGWLPVWPGLL